MATTVLPLMHIGEVREVGLGSFCTPVGLIQNFVEYIGVSCDPGWAGAIAVTTIGFRLVMLPLVVSTLRSNVKLMNDAAAGGVNAAEQREADE